MATWRVGLKWTKEGTAEVEADSEEEAAKFAEEHCLELTDDADPGAEISDWEVVGRPRSA